MTGNRPPPLPGEAQGYPRQIQVGAPVAPFDLDHGRIQHSANTGWKIVVAVAVATAFVVTTYWRIDSRLSAREKRDDERDRQIVDMSQKLDKVAGSERAVEARIVKKFRSGELYADCPAQTVRGVSTKPCVIRRLTVDEE